MASAREIRVKFFDTYGRLASIKRVSSKFACVDDLLADILQSLGIDPNCFILFGLRFTNQDLWLAPCVQIGSLPPNLSHKSQDEMVLELRMRFRPALFETVVRQDPVAFGHIFAQIRNDFMHSKFIDHMRDQIFIGGAIEEMIVIDMLRYAAEHGLKSDQEIKQIKFKDFIPRGAPMWHRFILSRLRARSDIYISMQSRLRNNTQTVVELKKAFIQHFLSKICKDYGSERFEVTCIDDSSGEKIERMTIRVRYNQVLNDCSCVIEYKLKTPKRSKSEDWIELGSIYTICYGLVLSGRVVEMNQSNHGPFIAEFYSDLHAKSFLSLISGYYKVMRKSHFSLASQATNLSKRYIQVNQLKFTNKQLSANFGHETNTVCSYSDLPKLIQTGMIRTINKPFYIPKNDMIVTRGVLSGEQEVVVKDAIDARNPTFVFHYDRYAIIKTTYRASIKMIYNLKVAQSRLPDWMFVHHPLFANTIGVDPLFNSLVQEFFPLGNLAKFLETNISITDVMIKSISCQLAGALLFLESKRIVHGKIRCHNIFIKETNPIRIKITDPLGTIDLERERAFLPPEYSDVGGEVCVTQYDTGIDIWALGTTLWQIYNRGLMPPPSKLANILTRPENCPHTTWCHMQSCWIVDPKYRAIPQGIFRDLDDSCGNGVHNYSHLFGPSSGSSVSDKLHGQMKPQTPPRSKLGSIGKLATRFGSQVRSLPLLNETSHNARSGVDDESSFNSTSRLLCLRNKNVNDNERQLRENSSNVNGNPSNLSDFYLISNSHTARPLSRLEGISSDWRINISHLKLLKVVGRGSSGVVYRGVLYRWGGVAIQTVAAKTIRNVNCDGSNNLDDFVAEFEIMKDLKHANIIRTIGLTYSMQHMILVIEYMPLGSLLSFIRNCSHKELQCLPLLKYARDIAIGMEYLESKRIVHRDLALRNILLKNRYEVKICDFGLAKSLGDANYYQTMAALPEAEVTEALQVAAAAVTERKEPTVAAVMLPKYSNRPKSIQL